MTSLLLPLFMSQANARRISVLSASVPACLLLAKIVLQDLNASGSAPQFSIASRFSCLFIP